MGKVIVNVQTEERLKAINNLSEAIYETAKALNYGTHVTVSNCTISSPDIGISVNTAEKISKTEITEVEDDDIE